MNTCQPSTTRTLPRCLPIALGLLAAAAACTSEGDDGPLTELEEVAADQTLYDTSINLTRNGVQDGMVDADSLHIWNDSSHVRVYGLTLFLYDEQGREKGRVTADAGRMNIDGVSNDLWAYGNALLSVPADELNEAREIEADELFFDMERDRIWTNVPVRMVRGGCRITGDGFQSDLSFNDLRIDAPKEGGCPES